MSRTIVTVLVLLLSSTAFIRSAYAPPDPSCLTCSTTWGEGLPDGRFGIPYEEWVAPDQANEWTFALEGGRLPAGLALDSDGRVAGVPAEAGVFDIVVSATHETDSSEQTFQLLIELPVPPRLVSALPSAVVGEPFSTPTLLDGLTPLEWTLTTSPGWLSIAEDGVLFGTPSAPATFIVAVTVEDPAGQVIEAQWTLQVVEAARPPRPAPPPEAPAAPGTLEDAPVGCVCTRPNASPAAAMMTAAVIILGAGFARRRRSLKSVR